MLLGCDNRYRAMAPIIEIDCKNPTTNKPQCAIAFRADELVTLSLKTASYGNVPIFATDHGPTELFMDTNLRVDMAMMEALCMLVGRKLTEAGVADSFYMGDSFIVNLKKLTHISLAPLSGIQMNFQLKSTTSSFHIRIDDVEQQFALYRSLVDAWKKVNTD